MIGLFLVCAMCANLSTYLDAVDQQRPTAKTTIMEGVSPKVIKFGFEDYVFYDGSKKGTAVWKAITTKPTEKGT